MVAVVHKPAEGAVPSIVLGVAIARKVEVARVHSTILMLLASTLTITLGMH